MIKNYTSNSKQTFDVIQKCLAQHKASQVMFEYNDNGQVKSLNFALKIGERFVGFRLPARVEKVEAIFQAENKNRWGETIPLDEKGKEQAYRTAWANIRDWLTAQMALIDTEQVKIEEVFLPYAVANDGKTFFEVMENKNFNMQLESGEPIEGEVV